MPCSIHESIFRHNRVMCLHSNAHTLLTNLNEKMDLQPALSKFQWVHKNVTQRKVQSHQLNR